LRNKVSSPAEHAADIGRTYYRVSIIEAHKLGLSTGIEIHQFPRSWCSSIIIKGSRWFLEPERIGIFRDKPCRNSETRYVTVDDISSAALGSKDVADSIKYDKFHFCSSDSKTLFSFGKRFKRIARKSARYFDEITDDGLLFMALLKRLY